MSKVTRYNISRIHLNQSSVHLTPVYFATGLPSVPLSNLLINIGLFKICQHCELFHVINITAA